MSAAPARAPRRPAPWAGLRLVPAPAQRPRLRRLMAVALAGMVAVGLLGLAGLHAVLATDQVKLDRLEAQVAAERDRFAARRLDVATLESPQRLRRAAQRLGLVAPPPGRTVYLVPSDATVRAVDGRPPSDQPVPPSPQLRADPAPAPTPAAPPVVPVVPADPLATTPTIPPAATTPTTPATTTPTAPPPSTTVPPTTPAAP